MSPRPKKPRHCECPHLPKNSLIFKQTGIPTAEMDKIHLGMDELEAMRLCDYEGLSQEDAGRRMNVSRGTVQRLVARGRKSVIDAMINARALVVTIEVAAEEEAED